MRWREALPKKDASKVWIFGESTATGTVQRVTDVQILRDSSFSAFPSRGRCRGATDEVERSATEERCIQGADLRGIDARRKLRATPDSRPTHPKGKRRGWREPWYLLRPRIAPQIRGVRFQPKRRRKQSAHPLWDARSVCVFLIRNSYTAIPIYSPSFLNAACHSLTILLNL